MRTPLKKQVKLLEINNTIDLILNSDSITGQLFLLDSTKTLGGQTQDQKIYRRLKKNLTMHKLFTSVFCLIFLINILYKKKYIVK